MVEILEEGIPNAEEIFAKFMANEDYENKYITMTSNKEEGHIGLHYMPEAQFKNPYTEVPRKISEVHGVLCKTSLMVSRLNALKQKQGEKFTLTYSIDKNEEPCYRILK